MSLVVQELSLVRNGVPHLGGVSATFPRGQLTAVIGRTLAGKTTLLRVIAGLQAIDGGMLDLDGRPFGRLPAWKRDVAMVYQQFINYPHLSVFENVAFPLRKKRLARTEVERRVREVLSTVGLADFGKRRPSAISGGQQQRVALARALVREANILLLDEPLVNLDYKLREQLRDEFRSLFSTQEHSVVIFNTTDPAEAMMIADQIVVMHEGRIAQIGKPADVFEAPVSVAVAEIINDPPMNILAGRIDGDGLLLGEGLRLPAPPRLATLPRRAYRFGVRAGELAPADEAPLVGAVTFSEVSGSETTLHVAGEKGSVVLQLEGVFVMPPGTRIGVAIPADRLFVFEDDGEGRLISAPAAIGGS
ncbi:MAG: ABC transporter ATP-binding protein [Hyphomicrobiales bacterium]|nr:ABC transporter ATP-binding protein [Hyphomicrobiales bacterium]